MITGNDCGFSCNRDMEEIMRRFSGLILAEMKKRNQSCVQFSELCGVGRNIVSDIINGKKKDVKLSTIVSICENSSIKIEDVFCINAKNDRDNMFKNTYIIINGEKFFIELKKIRDNTPPTRTL